MTPEEFKRAQEWREGLGMSKGELGAAIGYSEMAIYWFERGETPPDRNMKSGSTSREIKPWVWQRYKMACAGFAASKRKKFDW